MSIILEFRTVRQEDHYESEASICYIVSSSLVIEAYVFFKNPKEVHIWICTNIFLKFLMEFSETQTAKECFHTGNQYFKWSLRITDGKLESTSEN